MVGTSRCSTSVSAGLLPPITSFPISAKPIELTRNSSRFCCSSTMELLSCVEFLTVDTRSGAASAYALSVVVFYVLARYRLPMVPLLLLIAAGGIRRVGLGERGRMAVAAAMSGS